MDQTVFVLRLFSLTCVQTFSDARYLDNAGVLLAICFYGFNRVVFGEDFQWLKKIVFCIIQQQALTYVEDVFSPPSICLIGGVDHKAHGLHRLSEFLLLLLQRYEYSCDKNTIGQTQQCLSAQKSNIGNVNYTLDVKPS